jgi:hypothetical protein
MHLKKSNFIKFGIVCVKSGVADSVFVMLAEKSEREAKNDKHYVQEPVRELRMSGSEH